MVGALYTSVDGFDIVFGGYEYYIRTLYARDGTTAGVYEKGGRFDEVEAWHTANITVFPAPGGSRVLVRMDGELVYDKVLVLGRNHPYSCFYVYVIQGEGSICYADVDYVAIGPSVSEKLLDWYIYLAVYGRDPDGNYHSVSKSMYGSFGRGEPALDELSIRPAGYAVCTDDPLSLAIAGSVRRLLGVIGA